MELRVPLVEVPRCAGPAEPRASDFQLIALPVLAGDGAVCTLSRGWREVGVGLGAMKAGSEGGYSGTSWSGCWVEEGAGRAGPRRRAGAVRGGEERGNAVRIVSNADAVAWPTM